MKINQRVRTQNRNAAQDPPFRLQFWRRFYCIDVARLELRHATVRQK